MGWNRYWLVMPGTPSWRVIWLALSRPRYDGAPPVVAPAWTLPSSGSFSAPGYGPGAPVPKLLVCMFHVCSRKPRPYEKSCMRLWPTNRLMIDASMSALAGDVNAVGLHLLVYHWLVNGK